MPCGLLSSRTSIDVIVFAGKNQIHFHCFITQRMHCTFIARAVVLKGKKEVKYYRSFKKKTNVRSLHILKRNITACIWQHLSKGNGESTKQSTATEVAACLCVSFAIDSVLILFDSSFSSLLRLHFLSQCHTDVCFSLFFPSVARLLSIFQRVLSQRVSWHVAFTMKLFYCVSFTLTAQDLPQRVVHSQVDTKWACNKKTACGYTRPLIIIICTYS